MLGSGTTFINAIVTFSCSCLSLLGSILIILSYMIVRTRSTPKTAYLILHLAVSDFFWFLAAASVSAVWLITGKESVPDGLCYIASPVIIFTRMASLFWTVVISFNVLMSVQKRKWFWKSQEADWESYRRMYFAIICCFAFPGTLLNASKQYAKVSNAQLGCSPRYEPLGVWYEVLFPEVLPIVFAFLCNMYVFFSVRNRMSKAPVPLSVRKKRKRVMYHYVIVCILCWIPTIFLYFLEIVGYHLPALEIIARTSLYVSGFLNFLVFGLQDPHLSRSFLVLLQRLGLSSNNQWSLSLRANDVEKSVMFQEEALLQDGSRGRGKGRGEIFRTRKLSKDQKLDLYSDRPDLDPNYRTTRAKRKKSSLAASSSSSSLQSQDVPVESPMHPSPASPPSPVNSYNLNTPLLSKTRISNSKPVGDGLDSYFNVSSNLSASLTDTCNQLHVALLSELTGDPEQALGQQHAAVMDPSMDSAMLQPDIICNSGQGEPEDVEQGQGLLGEEDEQSVQEVQTPTQTQPRRQNDADDSSEDEIDEEDEDLYLMLFTQ